MKGCDLFVTLGNILSQSQISADYQAVEVPNARWRGR